MAITCELVKTVAARRFGWPVRKVPDDAEAALRTACSAETRDGAGETLPDPRRFPGKDVPPVSCDLVGDVGIPGELHAERALSRHISAGDVDEIAPARAERQPDRRPRSTC